MAARRHQACLLIGSNIQPEVNLRRCIDLLRHSVRIDQVSSVWETPPVGSDSADFLNLALLIETGLTADELKIKVIRPLETRLGRVRTADKNASRPIDIDIITFDGRILDPDLWQYAYRAVPVAEILPELRSGQGESLAEAAARLFQETHLNKKAAFC